MNVTKVFANALSVLFLFFAVSVNGQLNNRLLEAHYGLCGDLLDASSNGRNILNPTSASYTDAAVGKGAELLGNQGLEIPGIPEFTSSFSMALWVNVKDLSANKLPIITRKQTSPVMDEAVGLWVNNSGFYFHINGQAPFAFIGHTPATGNQFDHVVVAFDEPAGMLTLYINGALNKSYVLDNNVTIPGNKESIWVGRGNVSGSTPPSYLRGVVDEVRIYSRSIGSNEVKTLFDQGSIQPLEIKALCNEIKVVGSAGPEAGATYEWKGPNGFVANQRDIKVNEPGDYTLTVTVNGCKMEKILKKEDFQVIKNDFQLEDLVICCTGTNINLPAASTPEVNHELRLYDKQTGGNLVATATTQPYTLTIPLVGATVTYYYEAFDPLSKCASERKAVVIKVMDFAIPNVFTPNSDGRNDEFKLNCEQMGGNCEFFERVDMKIYDRNGHQVYAGSNQSWNGKVEGNGSDCIPGVYMYEINIVTRDQHTINRRGSLTLLR